MKNNGVEYASINICVVPCTPLHPYMLSRREKSMPNHTYLQVGQNQFMIIIENGVLTADYLKLATQEARLITRGIPYAESGNIERR